MTIHLSKQFVCRNRCLQLIGVSVFCHAMREAFFSLGYSGRFDLFAHLSIWKQEAYSAIQGTYPVIFLTFPDVKKSKNERTVCYCCRVPDRGMINEVLRKTMLPGTSMTTGEKQPAIIFGKEKNHGKNVAEKNWGGA